MGKIRTSVSIKEELQEQVERYAETTKRTVSAVHEMALEQFLAGVEVQAALVELVKFDDTAKGGVTGILKRE